MYEASFKLRHECPYRDFSEQFPGVTIREWQHSDCQVLEISSSTAPESDLLDAVDDIGTVLHSTQDDDGLYVVAQSCRCSIEDSMVDRFQEHSCIHVPPTVYRQGWEEYSVIAFSEDDIRALLAELDESRDVEVISKTAIDGQQLPHSSVFSVDRLFDGLTDRQLAALQIALDNDYYNQPRGASRAELAAQTDVARATFEEHLRKAENKLVSNVGQFVRLRAETQVMESLGVERGRSTGLAKSD